jgi:hypothetical protein
MSYNGMPNPLTVASFAERLSRQPGLAFAVVTAVSLGIVTLNAIQAMNDRQSRER